MEAPALWILSSLIVLSMAVKALLYGVSCVGGLTPHGPMARVVALPPAGSPGAAYPLADM